MQYTDSLAKPGFLRAGLELFSNANIKKDHDFFLRTLGRQPLDQRVLVLGGEASFAPPAVIKQAFAPVAAQLSVDLVPKAGHWIGELTVLLKVTIIHPYR